MDAAVNWAIVGLGVTPMGKIYGRRSVDFAAEAIALALDDAGLTKDDLPPLDFAVMHGVLSWIDEPTRTALLDDPMYVVLPKGHPLAGRRRLKLEELAGEEWIMGSNSGTCPDARSAPA